MVERNQRDSKWQCEKRNIILAETLVLNERGKINENLHNFLFDKDRRVCHRDDCTLTEDAFVEIENYTEAEGTSV